MNRLHWLEMEDLPYAEENKVVLRCTTGDSEWLDCTRFNYRLIVKAEPWKEAADYSDALINVRGEFPNEAEWLGRNNEPGRIVFRLSKQATTLNPHKKRYYCKIIENNSRVVFMGYFKIVDNGNLYLPRKGEDK